MWAFALAAVVTVFDLPCDVCAWKLIDSDGMPYLAIAVEGEAEGELAKGHARIRITVHASYAIGGEDIDVDDDGVADAIVFLDVEYDDGRTSSEIAIYTVDAGVPVPIHRFADDVPGWPVTSVEAERPPSWQRLEPDRWLVVERTNFRTRMVRGEVWVWDGDELVEDRSRRGRYPMPVGH